jgi:hypothetical protein
MPATQWGSKAVSRSSTGNGPVITYIDLTDAINEAIGMTGRFMRGNWSDILRLTLGVAVCFYVAFYSFSQPARDQFVEESGKLGADFSLLNLAGFLFMFLAAPIFTIGMVTFLSLMFARVSFAKDNLYWKRRGRSQAVISGLGVSVKDLWRDVHGFREALERKVNRRPTRPRWVSRILLFLSGLIALSPVLLAPFKDLEDALGTGNDSYLLRAFGVAFILYLVSRRLRAPPVGDRSYRAKAWVARLKGLGVIAAAFAITGVAARILDAVLQSGIFPSSQSSTILAGIYLLLAAGIGYGWLYAMAHAIGIGIRYILEGRKIGLAQAADRERRDPRAPITVLRSFADEAVQGELSYAALEAVIEEAASVYGPLIAAGAPGKLPAGEVGRQYFSHETWKEGVLDFLDRSLFVLLVPATTAGVQWEIDTIVERGHAGKLLLILMPTDDLPLRQHVLANGFQGTPWGDAVHGADFTKALAAYFKPDGRLVVFTSEQRDRADYQLAIHCAVHAMFCGFGGEGGTRSEPKAANRVA